MNGEIKDQSNESINNLYNDYNKDSVFDKFDITDLLNNDLLIPKVPPENFYYQKEIQTISNNSQTTEISTSEDNNNDIISKINTNNFGIKIDQLILTFPNDYKVPFIDLYTPLDLIGQGGFGIVLSVIDIKKNKKIAVKIIAKTNSHEEEFYLIEAELLKKLKNEKILKFHDVINNDNYLFIFTDLCEGGSLKDFIITRYNSKNEFFLKDSECAIIIKNLLQGIEYLVQNGVIHRDLKPENIMFKNKDDLNSLVICDLGIAGELKNLYSYMGDKCGTLTFMAPEILMNRQYDNLVDIWSTGIIMYILESGGSHPLLEEPKTKAKYIKDIEMKKPFYFNKNFPLIARNFFLKLCKYEPCFRYDINKALRHPWITRQNNKIPLTVIDNLILKDKITTFKEILLSMIFLNQFKKNNYKESQKIKRKLNIKKGAVIQDLYPSPFINNKNLQRKLSSPINNMTIFTRANSKCHTIKLKTFNTAQKHSERYNIYHKNSLSSKSKGEIVKKNKSIFFRNANILSNKKTSIKPFYKIITRKKSLPISNNDENICNNLKTPIICKKKSCLIIENDNKSLTIKMMKNKENININNWNNRMINNYSNKNNNILCAKIRNKCNFIEPKNLFHNSALKNICENSYSNIKHF